MMGLWQQVSNLKEHASHNPPGVAFSMCLVSLAITFIYFCSYSYTHTLPNPDITKDWNRLLSSLSQFQLCVKANASSPEPVSLVPTLHVDKNTVSPKRTSDLTSLRLKVPLTVTTNSNSGSLKDRGLHTAFSGSQLNLGAKEIVNVTLEAFPGNAKYTCLTISAPTHLLSMSLLPPECPAFEKNVLPVIVDVVKSLPAVSQTCYSLHFDYDPSLTVMLTQEEQRMAEKHLLVFSVFLLGVCLLLCLAASLRRPLKPLEWPGCTRGAL